MGERTPPIGVAVATAVGMGLPMVVPAGIGLPTIGVGVVATTGLAVVQQAGQQSG